jgi:choline dehydrogenase-like flavoprotein
MGRLQRTRRFEGEYRERLTGGMHHMGTTRMSDTEQCGVVDPDCRVYGSENLYVAGSSVFPRVGYANPTLTIVALAERLARHLASEA